MESEKPICSRNYVEQSPSCETNRSSASQEFPRILWNPKIRYRTHKSPARVPLQSQRNVARTSPSHFVKIHFKSFLPSAPGCLKWIFPSGFPTKTLYTPLHSSIRATCPAHLIFLDFITRTILGEKCRSFSSSLCSFPPLPCRLVPPKPKYPPQHPVLKHPQPAFLP